MPSPPATVGSPAAAGLTAEPPSLQAPKNWRDESLLQQEPFMTQFMIRRMGQTRRDKDTTWITKLAEDIQRDDEVCTLPRLPLAYTLLTATSDRFYTLRL